MLYIRAVGRVDPGDRRRSARTFSAELYESVGRRERVDWTCDHEHDNRFSALMCGQAALVARAAAPRVGKRSIIA